MTVTTITSLTPDTIEVLLTGDIPHTVDRKAFESYISDDKGNYTYTLDHYEPQTGHSQTEHTISMDEYWIDAVGVKTPHCEHVWGFIYDNATSSQLIEFIANGDYALLRDLIDIKYKVRDEVLNQNKI